MRNASEMEGDAMAINESGAGGARPGSPSPAGDDRLKPTPRTPIGPRGARNALARSARRRHPRQRRRAWCHRGMRATVRLPPGRGNQSGRLPHVIDPPEPGDDRVPAGRWQGRQPSLTPVTPKPEHRLGEPASEFGRPAQACNEQCQLIRLCPPQHPASVALLHRPDQRCGRQAKHSRVQVLNPRFPRRK